ncbi:MAG: hypothetical protein OQJ84_03595 [Xanthomonadales bacterium]|nr:hypothetical protein [Xanthomonadales bacterium]
MRKSRQKSALITIAALIVTLNAYAAWDRNIPKDRLPDPGRSGVEAAAAGPIVAVGTQTVAGEGECSFNSYTISGDVTGDTDDGGGLDSVTCEVWDDGALKDSETLTVPVGATQLLEFNLEFEGEFGTGAAGVGLVCNEIGFSADPFIPEEVAGSCPSMAVGVPTMPRSGLLILVSLIGLLGLSVLFMRRQKT